MFGPVEMEAHEVSPHVVQIRRKKRSSNLLIVLGVTILLAACVLGTLFGPSVPVTSLSSY